MQRNGDGNARGLYCRKGGARALNRDSSVLGFAIAAGVKLTDQASLATKMRWPMVGFTCAARTASRVPPAWRASGSSRRPFAPGTGQGRPAGNATAGPAGILSRQDSTRLNGSGQSRHRISVEKQDHSEGRPNSSRDRRQGQGRDRMNVGERAKSHPLETSSRVRLGAAHGGHNVGWVTVWWWVTDGLR